MPTTVRDGVSLAYECVGAGPAVMLIAGTGYAGATWHPDFVQALASRFTVITFDHRGTGLSGSSEDDYTTELFADDAVAVAAACSDGPVHVIGHSMGGRVAQWMAIQHPSAVHGLVLAASGVGAPIGADLSRVGVPVATAFGIATDGYREFIGTLQRATFFTPDYVAAGGEQVAWLEDAYWQGRPELLDYLKHVRARQAHSARARIAEITTPTLIVVGSLDTHQGGTGSHLDQSRELHELIPGSEFTILPDVKHGYFWERLDRTAQVIGDWLQKL